MGRGQAEIPGFRKGKAPTAMVLNHFGKESVSAEACEKIIGAAVPMALQMKDIRAIGQVPATLSSEIPASTPPLPPSSKSFSINLAGLLAEMLQSRPVGVRPSARAASSNLHVPWQHPPRMQVARVDHAWQVAFTNRWITASITCC